MTLKVGKKELSKGQKEVDSIFGDLVKSLKSNKTTRYVVTKSG